MACCNWLKYFLVLDSIAIITKAIEGWLQKYVACQSSFLMDLGKMFQLTYIKLYAL